MTATILPFNQEESISAKEVLRLYANDLAEQSFCLDVSSDPIQLLHAGSGYRASIKELEYGFSTWAKSKGVRVSVRDYPAFIRTLVNRLPPLMHRVLGVAFRPVPQRFFDRFGVKLANTYAPFRPDVSGEFVMPEILEEYLQLVLPNGKDRNTVIMWLADIIQNPLRRPMWGVLLTGDSATGKSSLIRLVRLALGERHVWSDNTYTPAFARFSEVFCNNLLVAFDDAPASTDTYEKLKLAMTRPVMNVETKGVQGYVERDVYSRVLILSNDKRPLRFGEDERRLYVPEFCNHPISKEETQKFFTRFNAWVSLPETAAIIYQWLMSVDLSEFTPGFTVQTETHAKMVGLSASVLDGLLVEYVEEDPIFHEKMLLAYLADNGLKSPNLDSIKLKLEGLGYVRRRRKVPDYDDKQHFLWQKDAKRSRELTAEESERICDVLTGRF